MYTTKPLVVLDTNVYVSALLLPQSIPGKIIQFWFNQSFKIIISDPAISELIRVFSRSKFTDQFSLSPISVETLIKNIKFKTIVVNRLKKPKVAIRDPKDTVILATAIDGHADYLVTGDQDLLVLVNHKSIKPLKIISPTEFLQLFDSDIMI
ncbi:putative toxin-antitoxin system toxin component, PIN family [Candidatus Collierbacteria bacterium CG09_land_8_20_14_0_10_46_12]|uniref:Putative toxin-antitoxin system toxin component, PIN family n=1 Tax=Candidatus Collierbacteria bacterium CG09_land_8_20_14_0_10_46_12 TaxID=1974533 RepID=A0A2H0WZ42_9BACT|nr:MAG: putative toxin-antitoxin system toxin component, PIN family [Candidatus Collierbacteria bacterium CG09_land_8_20_14_0_10_46_12]